MSTEEEVDIDFDVNDKASPKLTRMEKLVKNLDGAVGRASDRFMSMTHMLAGMGVYLGLGQAISGAKEYINQMDSLSNLSGIAADRIAGVSTALQETGASASTVDGVMARMTKRGALLEEGQKGMATMAKRYGVNLADGPEKVLVKMADLVDKNKIGAGQVGRILGVSGDALADMMDSLNAGPKELATLMDDARKKNAFLTEEAMDGMQRWHNASQGVGLAFKRLTAGIMIKLGPAMEKISIKLYNTFDSLLPVAQRFGDYLVKNIDQLIAGAKTYAKIMLINTAVNKLTGGKAGIVGVASGAIKGYAKGGFKGMVGGMGEGGKILYQFFSGAMKLRPILSSLSRIGIIGAVFGVIAGAFKALSDNVGGIRDRLSKLFGSIWDKVKSIGGSIAKIFSGDGPLGRFFTFLGTVFLGLVEKIGQAVNAVLWLVQKIIDLIPSIFSGGVGDMADKVEEAARVKKFMERDAKRRGVAFDEGKYEAIKKKIWAGGWDASTKTAVDATKAARKGTPDKPVINQDFRGSRFDIKQEFAEGFDPDRIAVSFANDIASMGERKLQSGFSPLFTIR